MDNNKKQVIEISDKIVGDLNRKYQISICEESMCSVIEKLGGIIRYRPTNVKKETHSSIFKLVTEDYQFVVVLEDTTDCDMIKNRMYVAQELGHLFLHMGYMGCLGEEIWDKMLEEAEYNNSKTDMDQANIFARAFLMPKDSFTEDVKNPTFTASSLAKKYKVKISDIYQRWNDLELSVKK